MRKEFNRGIGIALLALGLGAVTVAGAARAEEIAGQVMPGQILGGGVDHKQLAERATARRFDPLAPPSRQLALEPPAAAVAEKSEPVKGIGVPLRIGTHRELPKALLTEMSGQDLVWEQARGGGQVAAFTVTSPGAKALRLALDFHSLPRGAEVRFYSPAEPSARGGVFAADFLAPAPSPSPKAAAPEEAEEPFWSPVVSGETAVVEVWVPGWGRGAEVRLSLRRLSHLDRALDDKDLRDLGASGSCNRDIACFKKWTTAADAVAKFAFESGGFTGLCTGQLMANEKGKFLFLTAAHCVSSRREAGTTTFFWRFQRNSCGGPNPNSVIQTGGGARLLFTSASFSQGLVTDHTLMQLKRDPSTLLGAVATLGWAVGADPDDNLRAKVHAPHHPGGDVKKGSRGKVQDTWQLQPDGNLAGGNPPTHYQVGWQSGTTEPGSSGGAILIGKRWPEQFVIGVLTGGFASCQDRRAPDFYGLFEETFRRYKKFRKHFL